MDCISAHPHEGNYNLVPVQIRLIVEVRCLTRIRSFVRSEFVFMPMRRNFDGYSLYSVISVSLISGHCSKTMTTRISIGVHYFDLTTREIEENRIYLKFLIYIFVLNIFFVPSVL